MVRISPHCHLEFQNASRVRYNILKLRHLRPYIRMLFQVVCVNPTQPALQRNPYSCRTLKLRLKLTRLPVQDNWQPRHFEPRYNDEDAIPPGIVLFKHQHHEEFESQQI
ncbi:hypothetical protein TNCV_2486221 [Trichonephila clavipes]|uniref:Uncharacterized protein n=1 Tax=Trichonephila clavipes TaxID=2585209 RepID=A0A8X7BCH8_TRICX|nr:hypothetical protein TNCV_2486221 [Trichonephila clavipes]